VKLQKKPTEGAATGSVLPADICRQSYRKTGSSKSSKNKQSIGLWANMLSVFCTCFVCWCSHHSQYADIQIPPFSAFTRVEIKKVTGRYVWFQGWLIGGKSGRLM
jgi:hypothetical protein